MALLLEGGLIVFSVLFALFIDRIAEDAKTGRQKKAALARIHDELQRNDTLLGELIQLHDVVIKNLNAAVANGSDTIRRRIARDGYLDYRLLANGRSLFPRYPSGTAWEAAKSTTIIAEFDYLTIEACAAVYTAQDVIVNRTLVKIADELFEIDNTQPDKKLIKLRLEFEEILAQEKTLKYIMKNALERTR